MCIRDRSVPWRRRSVRWRSRGRSSAAIQAYAGIQHRIDDVHHEVQHHKEEHDQQQIRHHHRTIQVDDGIDQQLAHAGPREHRLGHHREGHYLAELQARHGDHRLSLIHIFGTTNTDYYEDNQSYDLNATGKYTLLGRQHDVVIGANYSHMYNYGTSYYGTDSLFLSLIHI